jgi:tetratricopeptide (TPR) repeat protein
MNASDEAFLGQFNLTLSVAASFMLKGLDLEAFTQWGVKALPMLLASDEEGLPADPMIEALNDPGFAGLFARAIYAAMPLPSRRFKPAKLQLPERNEPCCCGSGKKFKLCCGAMAQSVPRFPPELCAGPMLDAMGKSAWAKLPGDHMPVALVACVAFDWRDQGRVADLVRLLEPWLPKQGPIPDDRADLLDLLGDAYADLRKPRKRKDLAQAMIERGGREVQAKGWQRVALMACDAGQYAVAHDAFLKSQRLAPDDPSLSVLELSLLIGEGRTDRLHERADFWARSLTRRNQQGEYDGLIETIRDMGNRGNDMLLDTMVQHTPGLKMLADWVSALPAPELSLQLGPRVSPKDLGPLTPNAAQAKAMLTWRKAFDIGEPQLVSMATHDSEAWEHMDLWLPVLQANPVLANSFDVLDELVLLLTAVDIPGAERVAAQLVARALDLWMQIRARYPKALCEWGHWDNRPALRLIAHHIVADPSPTAEQSFEWLKAMVEVLNPNDNHGFRERLMAVYVRRGLLDEALALAKRYPEDSDAMELLKARALWALGRKGDAIAVMHMVFVRSGYFAKVWRSTKLPAPQQSEYVRFGSDQEARLAYRAQHDLWQDAELRATVMKVSKGLSG